MSIDFDSIHLNSSQLNSTQLEWNELYPIDLNSFQVTWTQQNWDELITIHLPELISLNLAQLNLKSTEMNLTHLSSFQRISTEIKPSDLNSNWIHLICNSIQLNSSQVNWTQPKLKWTKRNLSQLISNHLNWSQLELNLAQLTTLLIWTQPNWSRTL